MTKQIFLLTLTLLCSTATVVWADEKEDKVARAVAKLGAKLTRGTDGHIEIIDYRTTKVTDADLRILKDLKHLQSLYLGGTEVTDGGLSDLREIKSLIFVGLLKSKVTDNGIRVLQACRYQNAASPRSLPLAVREAWAANRCGSPR